MSQITAFVLGGGGGSNVLTLTGNSGGAVGPTAGNINVVGTGSITVTGNPGTSTLTISDSGGGITSITGDSGGAQSGPAITITGGTSGGLFAGAANTLTLAFTELNLPTTSNNTHGVININGVPVFHTFGTNNLFVGAQGAQAGNFTLSATNCTVVGGLAGQSITNSNFSHFFGWGAGLNSTGIANSYFGYTAGVTNIIGQYNCAFGMQAGTNNSTSGSYNIFIGYFGGANFTGSESSNVLLNSGGVASDNNTLRIGASTGSGTQQLNKAFIHGIRGITTGNNDAIPVLIDSAGQLGTAVLPSFTAYQSASTTDNKTGDGTFYSPIFDTVVFNNGSGYNNGTGVFTAPKTGKYMFTASITMENLSSGHNASFFRFTATSRNFTFQQSLNPFAMSSSGFLTIQGTAFIDMTATDTCFVEFEVNGSTKTVGVFGTTNPSTTFSGYYVGL
jgi:hypothetical protein